MSDFQVSLAIEIHLQSGFSVVSKFIQYTIRFYNYWQILKDLKIGGLRLLHSRSVN